MVDATSSEGFCSSYNISSDITVHYCVAARSRRKSPSIVIRAQSRVDCTGYESLDGISWTLAYGRLLD